MAGPVFANLQAPPNLVTRAMSLSASLFTIPARAGKAVPLAAGQRLRVVNTHGQQVVDTWAFVAGDPGEFMSMEHTRPHLGSLFPAVGDVLRSNRRRPLLTLLEDTSGGRHDTLIAACDRYRYEMLGCTTPHANCTDNLHAALAELGLRSAHTPCPLNLFMNIPVSADGGFTFEAPRCTPGGAVTLVAERDLVVVFSACPQDLVPVNGLACTPTEAHFQLLPGTSA